jgi:Family of unknown function (DUF6459)
MPGQPQISPARSQPARRPRRDPGSRGGPGEVLRPAIARPLPDPVAIRLCQVPDTAPPYDDAVPGEPGPGRAGALAAAIVAALGTGDVRGRSVQASSEGPRADRRPLRPVRPARPPGRAGRGSTAQPAGTAGQGSPTRPASQASPPSQAGTARPAGARPAGAARPSPEPQGWPSRFAQVLAETLAGSRPPAQIAPWTTERARSHRRKLGPLLTAGQRPLVQRVITSEPSAGVVEMAVVVGFGPRVRALAVRLERTGPRQATAGRAARPLRWVCTAVEAA